MQEKLKTTEFFSVTGSGTLNKGIKKKEAKHLFYKCLASPAFGGPSRA